MTTLDDLVRLVEERPDDDLAAMMLTDELLVAKDMLRTEADTHVRRVRLVGQHARDLASAAQLLQRGRRSAGPLYREMRRHLAPHVARQFVAVVVAGDQPPACTHPGTPGTDAIWTGPTVTVGATWLLRFWLAHCEGRQHRPTRRPE